MVDGVAASLGTLAFTGLMTVVGAALATNHRDSVTRHVRAAQRKSPRLRRGATEAARFVLLDRMLGVLFAVVEIHRRRTAVLADLD
jgi:hypothetical protein